MPPRVSVKLVALITKIYVVRKGGESESKRSDKVRCHMTTGRTRAGAHTSVWIL